jgi:FolB domain-containing protein
MVPSSSDTVFVDTLHLSATIGPDCWGKTRPQALSISVYLNLEPKYLVASGEADEVEKSVHYGLLTKKVTSLIRKKNEEDGWDGVDALVRDVAEEAFELGGECVQSVRVVVEVPKVILLASSYTVDTTLLAEHDQPNVPTTLQPSIRRPRERRPVAKKVEVKEVVVPVIIGVNPPERLAKQRVMTDLVFYERVGEDSVGHVRYAKVVDALVKVRPLPSSFSNLG